MEGVEVLCGRSSHGQIVPGACAMRRANASTRRAVSDRAKLPLTATGRYVAHRSPLSQADSQPVLDSELMTTHKVTVPRPCQNGGQTRGSHGRSRTTETSLGLGRNRMEAGREPSP